MDGLITQSLQIKKGDTITISYGQHSNSELVLSYGFVLPGNPNVEYKLDYSIELLQVSKYTNNAQCRCCDGC